MRQQRQVASAPTAAASRLSSGEIARLFAPRTIADYQRLSRRARDVLAAVHRLGGGLPFEGGQAALVEATGASVRTVKRAVALLERSGFLAERRRQRPLPAVLVAHPVVEAAIALEGAGALRRAGRLGADSLALRCAAVRRPDGRPFLAAPYVVDLMTKAERDLCRWAAAVGAPLCDDPAVNAEITTLFRLREVKRRQASADHVAVGKLRPMPELGLLGSS